jgi:flagellar basal-body rod protein FlgG
MLDGMIDAARGCLKEEVRMGAIANNLANANSVGYKKDRISFQQILGRIEGTGAEVTRKGTGPLDSSLLVAKTDFDQGDIRFTGNTLDLAVYGRGFFKVNTQDGIRYTRKGNFRLDAEGFLVSESGHKVLGKDGPIDISGNEIYVDSDGVLSVDGSEAGQIDVVDFENYSKLLKEGDGLFRKSPEDQEIALPSESEIKQGYLEISNVNAAEEIVQMIQSLRAFESYQKAIQVIDSINRKAINDVSRLR